MGRKPIWKETMEQQEEYNKRGIYYCYNDRNRKVYLSVLAAPMFVEGREDAQMTGHLTLDGGVHKAREIDNCVLAVKRHYTKMYKDNPAMLKYADTII